MRGADVTPSRILIAEDDLTAQWVLQVLLRKLGYQVRSVETGGEALLVARELRPDLILLAAGLPDIDAFEVCRLLRRDEELADVPIMMLTSFDDRGERLRGLGAGADDFISKPFDDVELTARVRTVTRLRRVPRAARPEH